MQISDQEENFKTPPALVYQTITDHQQEADEWANREKLLWLREWGQIFIKEFGLKVKDGEYLHMPLVKVEPLNIKTVCRYQKAPDGYALAGTILANEKRLKGEPDFTALDHLLKALIHAWLHEHRPDEVFVQESLEGFKRLGIAVTKKLITIEKGSRFAQLLRKHEIDIPEGQSPKPKVPQGKSTNMLWSCLCQKVRVGTGSFDALCLRCKSKFQPGNHVKFHWSKTTPRRTALAVRSCQPPERSITRPHPRTSHRGLTTRRRVHRVF